MPRWNQPFTVHVWGELACFTRPEQKVERVSYPMMTPSAARGVLESIFWRPGLVWHVERIAVLRPIRFMSFVRNEISSKQSILSAANWARSGNGGYSTGQDRTQRQTLALRDVAYVITAQLLSINPAAEDALAAARDQFRRRLSRGQCFQGPYLGCREFRCDFAAADGTEQPIALSCDFGSMLYDIEYRSDGQHRANFFHAELREGVLLIPSPARSH